MKYNKSGDLEKNLGVNNYLFDGEKILQSYKNLYATDRRLIQVKGSGFFDVAYKHITTIEYKRYHRISAMIIGLLLVIISYFYFYSYIL
ncbi:MAG: hypothetical protein ACP5U0_08720 [Caldisphaera sp.]